MHAQRRHSIAHHQWRIQDFTEGGALGQARYEKCVYVGGGGGGGGGGFVVLSASGPIQKGGGAFCLAHSKYVIVNN